MRFVLLFMLLVSVARCTTSRVGEVDYCHNQDGTYNSDGAGCQRNINPIIFEDMHDHSNRR
jgi:hypothetical protein